MSRIQDILAKAERDRTARVTHVDDVEPAAAVVTRIPIPLVNRTLDPTPAIAPAAAALGPSPLPNVVQPARRTARPTLHPTVVSAIAPHSDAAERYRALRTRVAQREELTPMRVIGITSPGAQEGKSVTAANLAVAMAQEFHRTVLLIDGVLRTPTIHSLFGIDDRPGLSEVLSGAASVDDAVVGLPELRLSVLTAGEVPELSSELLGSSAMRRTLDVLRTRFDRIVIDLPAVTPLADVGTVAPMLDGALIVVRVGHTLRPALEEALTAFDEQRVLGIVLNETH